MRMVEDALTFDDVLLLPAESAVLPKDVNLKTQLTRQISLNIPLVAAAMDTVTEAALAIALAQEGGIGIIHRNMPAERQAAEVRQVKKFESGVVKDPLTVSPSTPIRELIEIGRSHNFHAFPVVDENRKLVGIVTGRDLRFETNIDQPVSKVMTPQERLVTVKEPAVREEVIQLLRKHRIEKVLVVNEAFHLKGMITVKDILKETEKPFACKDESGQLRVGAAVGTGADVEARAEALIAAGVDLLVVDTAHGHAKSVIEKVRWLKKQYPNYP